MATVQTVPPVTLADILWPRKAAHPWLAETALVVLFSGFVAICAQLRIPLPFTPVPITGQTLGVFLTGASLGSRRGALALLLYLAEGAVGLPVFAGGAAGAAHLAGPTAGYLVACPVAAGVVGWLAERKWDRRWLSAVFSMLLGSLVILLAGVLWLSVFVGGFQAAFVEGALPFIPGELIKAGLAACLLPAAWTVVRRARGQS